MNVNDTSLDAMVEDEFASDADMDLTDIEFSEAPQTSSRVVSGSQNNARLPGGEDPDDSVDEGSEDAETPAPRIISDAEITARVRRLLRSDSATRMLRIQAVIEDGVVTLRGLVQTLDDTDNAAEVASRVEGVIDVVDELEVEP